MFVSVNNVCIGFLKTFYQRLCGSFFGYGTFITSYVNHSTLKRVSTIFYNVCSILVRQDFVTSIHDNLFVRSISDNYFMINILYQLLHQLFVFVSNLDFEQD